jgi:hypothetical protein
MRGTSKPSGSVHGGNQMKNKLIAAAALALAPCASAQIKEG